MTIGGSVGNVFSDANDMVDDALSSVGIGVKSPMSPYMAKAKDAAKRFMAKPWRQGWQWEISTDADDAPSDLDMYVKDIDYGAGSVDVDVDQVGTGSISKITFSAASEITMTVRDDELNTISNWIQGRINKIRNPDGTVNLPISYLITLNIHTLNSDGEQTSKESIRGYFIKCGNKNHTREGGNTNESFPVIFQKYSTLDFGGAKDVQ
ncbi:hypothetical protein I6Y99_004427 [Vibrio parahaemolyticus]|nr:hypothetical protein [Vibrio parahaemolyticus]